MIKSFFTRKPSTAETSFLPHFLLTPWVAMQRLIFVTGACTWLFITALALYTYQLFQAIPEYEALTFPLVRSHAQAIHAAPTIDIPPNNGSSWINLKDVNRDLLYAIVLSEDATFFSHKGIDYDALILALVENTKTPEWRFGTRTISQQTASNLYLNNVKTLSQKFQEVVTTYRLENTLSKNEILELYLNLIEFGPDLYGIGNASRYYFNKSPADVNAAEGAYLALLMPSPREYHHTLFQNGNWSPALMKKHQRILRDMQFKELISHEQYKTYQEWFYNKANYFSGKS